jgi:hypothetical protein
MFFFRHSQGGRWIGQGYSQRIFRSAPVALKRVERLRHSRYHRAIGGLQGIGSPGPHDQAIIGLSGDGEGAFVLLPEHYRTVAGWKVALKRPNARASFFS